MTVDSTYPSVQAFVQAAHKAKGDPKYLVDVFDALVELGQRPLLLQTKDGACKIPFFEGAWGERTIEQRRDEVVMAVGRNLRGLGIGFQPSGRLLVLDLDPPGKNRARLGEVMDEFVRLCGGEVVDTFTVSGQGGSHLWLWVDQEFADQWAGVGLGKRKIKLPDLDGAAIEVFMPLADGAVGSYQVATAPSPGKAIETDCEPVVIPPAFREFLIEAFVKNKADSKVGSERYIDSVLAGGVFSNVGFIGAAADTAKGRWFMRKRANLIANIASAAEGNRYDSARDNVRALAGWAAGMGYEYLREEIVEEAISAAESTGKTRHQVEGAIRWAWAQGIQAPCFPQGVRFARIESEVEMKKFTLKVGPTGFKVVERQRKQGPQGFAGEPDGSGPGDDGDWIDGGQDGDASGLGGPGGGGGSGGGLVGGDGQWRGPRRLPKTDPYRMASDFLARARREGSRIVFWRDTLWQFDGTRYVTAESSGLRQKVAGFVADTLAANPDKDGVCREFTVNVLRSVIELIQTLASPEGKYEEPLFWLDEEQRPAWWTDDVSAIVVCGNGVLDMVSGSFDPVTDSLFRTSHNGIEWKGPDEPAVEFQKWLAEVQPEEETRTHLGWLAGYVMSNKCHVQKAFYLFGGKRTGKGSFLRVLEGLVGDTGCGSTTIQSLSDPYGLAGLEAKRLITCGDLRIPKGFNDGSTAAARILSITGRDMIPVRRMRKDPISVRFFAKLIFASNNQIDLPDESGTIATRFITYGFNQSFADHVDNGRDERIWRAEQSGILAWAVRAYNDFISNGADFPINADTIEAVEQSMRAADPFIAFKQDCMVRLPSETCALPVDNLRASFAQYVRDKNPELKRPSENSVLKSMKSNQIKSTRPGDGPGRKFMVQGWGLNETGLEYLKQAENNAETQRNQAELIRRKLQQAREKDGDYTDDETPF